MRVRKALASSILLVLLVGCQPANTEVVQTGCLGKCDGPDGPIAQLAGVTKVFLGHSGSCERYDLMLEQPVLHTDPRSARFEQRAILTHCATDAPVVVYLNGYSISSTWDETELTSQLKANQLHIEHRYFGRSRPATLDWSALTIAQAAADVHAYIQLLKPIYKGPWLTTGASKGGMASVYHRRFYPQDVDATVVYVAPLYRGAPDRRYLPFFEQVGPQACRQQLRDVQRALLTRRGEVEPYVVQWGQGRNLTYDKLGVARALEAATVWLPWYFWQYLKPSDCSKIPAPSAPLDELVWMLSGAFWQGPLDWVADQTIDRYDAYHVQRLNENGHPQLPYAAVQDLLQSDPPTATSAYLPQGAVASFRPEAMADIDQWVRSEGRQLLFIYGETDPYTFVPYPLGAKDSARFVAPGANHDASIGALAAEDKQQALELLGRWLSPSPAGAR